MILVQCAIKQTCQYLSHHCCRNVDCIVKGTIHNWHVVRILLHMRENIGTPKYLNRNLEKISEVLDILTLWPFSENEHILKSTEYVDSAAGDVKPDCDVIFKKTIFVIRLIKFAASLWQACCKFASKSGLALSNWRARGNFFFFKSSLPPEQVVCVARGHADWQQ